MQLRLLPFQVNPKKHKLIHELPIRLEFIPPANDKENAWVTMNN